MKILRSAIIAAGVAATTAMTFSPASADPGAVAFSGTATIACFGCGDSTGTATLQGEGATAGRGVVSGSASATFTVNEPAVGPACVVTGTATGSVTGAINVTFGWTRVGATAVITTNGEITGAGAAAFHVTSPSGIPCGASNVTADVAGAVAGI